MGNKREEAKKKKEQGKVQKMIFLTNMLRAMIHKKLCKYGDGLRLQGSCLYTATEIYTTTNLIYFKHR